MLFVAERRRSRRLLGEHCSERSEQLDTASVSERSNETRLSCGHARPPARTAAGRT